MLQGVSTELGFQEAPCSGNQEESWSQKLACSAESVVQTLTGMVYHHPADTTGQSIEQESMDTHAARQKVDQLQQEQIKLNNRDWSSPWLIDQRKMPSEQVWFGVAMEVREAFAHAWKGYRMHAWGTDELRPLSKTGYDPFGGVGLTIIDSLTTLLLLEFDNEFEEAASYVEEKLVFGTKNMEVSTFELTIRALGGLLGAHALVRRPKLLDRARELAEKILPAFNTSSGMPLPSWNLVTQTGGGGAELTNIAEVGSLQLEWRYVSEHTGDSRFDDAVTTAFDALHASGTKGLLPVHFSPSSHSTPQPVRSKFGIGGQADSYYEYLLKQWIHNQTQMRPKELFLTMMQELPALVRPWQSTRRQHYKIIEVEPDGKEVWKMEHLSCFLPGTIALALLSLPDSDISNYRQAWQDLAEGILASCVEMWVTTPSGLAPEHVLVNPTHPHSEISVPVESRHSFLRPETVESLYYMYHLTRDDKYRKWGEKIFRAIVRQGKTEVGFASVADVRMAYGPKMDKMHSFVLAETFKYLYMLFSPPGLLDLSRYVLNTEGHPLLKSSTLAPTG